MTPPPELVKRNLSGLFFRFQQPDGSWDNVCFEDLPREEQERQMATRHPDWIKGLAKRLAEVLREVGDQFDIARKAYESFKQFHQDDEQEHP